ncbi:SGNH/GDSL hydrolase family protein [Bradyrhizobium sp. BR13661]|uniref:SGNH/GDSL hydrolase family protein n=2 Tax=Pseudomonadota TaxID=1224 RepID=UPI0024735EFB|nr:SGNH/GDSL hydrolase family protein [Bradyrhizobium sp. BR13661]MDH6260065.1 lysophospholipase L1-like esterase [Bradyrhizobium sp. BR13661]
MNLKSLGSTLVVILLSLLAVEAALRLADFRVLRQDVSERSLSYDYDAELGWIPVPNSEAVVTTARTIHARHNSLGLRDIEYRPDGRQIVLFLGDSFVWGVDAEANERFTDLLRERLPRLSIVNAGVSGYGTDQELIWLKRLWPTIKPAIVVLVFCTDNDRLDNGTNVRYGGYRKPYFETSADGTLIARGQPVPKSLKLLIRDEWLPRHLRLARLASFAYVELHAPQLFVPDPTDRLVGAIDDFIASNGARLLVALQHKDDQLISYLQQRRIPFVTLDGAQSYGAEHGAHFTPEGNRFVSQLLERFLGEQASQSSQAAGGRN